MSDEQNKPAENENNPEVNISAVGDVVQGNKVIKGDAIGGDNINISGVSGSNVIVGNDNVINAGETAITVFETIKEQISQLPISEEQREEVFSTLESFLY